MNLLLVGALGLVVLGDGPVMQSVRKVLGAESNVIAGTEAVVRKAYPWVDLQPGLKPDGYRLKTVTRDGVRQLFIVGSNERGVLYGAFGLQRKIALRQPVTALDEKQEPYAPVRWVNEWNNLDGTIERGYAGKSLWFENDNIRADLSRASGYGRLLAEVGINGVTVNNVNANPRVITAEFLPQLARLAAAFRPWGVRISVSIDFSSPQKIGGLDTFDPGDPRVVQFWKQTVDRIYEAVPDLGGFVLKADSEGRVGPSAYGRTHADAANVIARALKPHGGVIFYRGFVYDHRMDWRNLKNDRARAAYDNFQGLDGQFDDNVVIQIKHGPIDFQVREPASPLFGALEKTNQAIELQITQEYFGQARHMVFLVPMWKAALDFDLQAKGAGTPVKALVAGKVFGRPTGGFVGVSNVGLDANWTGHPLSMANLYGYGRLAWNPDLSSQAIAEEWVRQTYGHNPRVVATITDMLLKSWPVFEYYTGPLGAQTLTEITGNHYGPAVEASERNGWGQWHRADAQGIGMDRTVATGTGFIGQYRAPVAKVYESLATCPDELLLWMHHVPYRYQLKSGKTVIQHIYDTHYQGAAEVEEFVAQWRGLRGLVAEPVFSEVLKRLEYQAGHAQVWRDSINSWFLKTSGIADERGRAGHYPGRTEAEAMMLTGYTEAAVTPWETASGSKAVVCLGGGTRTCTASLRHQGEAGQYVVDVQYFDQVNGASKYKLLVGEKVVDEWIASDTIPTRKPDGHSSMRRRIGPLPLRPGDVIQIVGQPDGGEAAALDYVEIRKERP
ncbi:MAG TPA: alpha-glucuronidase family glycosyl hydrolase [Paludibaculum sp.]|jgi:alpha-glucuronidase